MVEISGGTLRVGVVGGTGMIGRELLSILAERRFPCGELRVFASARSRGAPISAGQEQILVEEFTDAVFSELDLVFLCAGKEVALATAANAVDAGCTVIDNSSAFRSDPAVPLVVPEINAPALSAHAGLIANPNCSTIVNAMAVAPLARRFGLRRMVVATYQAASGAGAAAQVELDAGVRAHLAGEDPAGEVFPEGLAFNVIPRIGLVEPDGTTDEERKMLNESRKILHLPDLQVVTTCVRVPVSRCHGVATTLFFQKPADLQVARELLAAAPGVALADCPTPRAWSRKDDVAVGRMRVDPDDPEVLSFFAVGDQIRKGGALNAVQIAERLEVASGAV